MLLFTATREAVSLIFRCVPNLPKGRDAFEDCE